MNIILLIISLVIYGSFGLGNFVFVTFSILTCYWAARCFKTKWRRFSFVATISVNAVLLLISKFWPYGLKLYPGLGAFSVFVSLGISYYSLQLIAYLVDVYRGKYEAETNFWHFALCIMYIPQLFIGPISRYDEIKSSIFKKRKISSDNILSGLWRISLGLAKKLIIAGRISLVIATITKDPNTYQGAYALLAMLLYSLQLYSDFSGGIDVVLGVSKMLDIDLVENFNNPFSAQTIKEFWRRWHVSLSSWIRDYIYIPLGGSRCGEIRKAANLLLAFIVSGLWHGLNYLWWGVWHGLFVLTNETLKTKFKILNYLLTFLVVSILWAFFIWPDSATAIKMIISLFTNFNYPELMGDILKLGLNLTEWSILSFFVVGVLFYDGKKEKWQQFWEKAQPEGRLALIGSLVLVILVLGIYGIGFNVEGFIYGNF